MPQNQVHSSVNPSDIAMDEMDEDLGEVDIDGLPIELVEEMERHAEECIRGLFAHEWMRQLYRHIDSIHGPQSLQEHVVLFLLLRHADADGRTRIKPETLARKAKIARVRIVRNVLRKLERDGWIQLGPTLEIRVLQQRTTRTFDTTNHRV